eukprot:g2002.t1
MSASDPITLYYTDGETDTERTMQYTTKLIHYKLLPNGTAVCTYATPKNLNALTPAQMWDTYAILAHCYRDERVRCLVWTGRGRAFGAGAALGARAGAPTTIPKHVQASMKKAGFGPDGTMVLRAMTLAHWDLPKPSIVAVNGLAVGGHANIALVNFHDLVICSTDARFKYPFAQLGFTPELGSSMMMPQIVGPARAKEIMFLGDWFSAQDAKEMGLVNRVVEPEELMPTALKIADRLCAQHPAALRRAKEILNRAQREQLDRNMEQEQIVFMKSMRETGGPMGVKKWREEEMAKREKRTASKL